MSVETGRDTAVRPIWYSVPVLRSTGDISHIHTAVQHIARVWWHGAGVGHGYNKCHDRTVPIARQPTLESARLDYKDSC